MKLDFLFNPKSIAIVGVSSDPKKLGSVVLTNLISSGYEGSIFPVNPKYEELYGLKCYQKVSDIEHEVDLICVVVPNELVNSVIEDAGLKQVKGAVVITAGFGESGEKGAQLEKEVMETARKHNIRIMGPNCLGEIVTKSKINLSFAASNALSGNIAFLSQSGAFLTAMLDMSLEKNLGFSHLVSIGNKSDIGENEFIEEWLMDDEVKAIGAYLEDIEAGHKLVEIYKKSGNKKPFVIFKPGESEESQKAISSHTGSIAGSYEVFETAMQQSGISVAKDINDMFNFLLGFSWSKLPKGNRVGIITNAGGPGVITTDYLSKNDLVLAQIDQNIQRSLAEKLPFNASTHNPVDLIGDANAERYRNALEALMKDDNVDSIIILLTPQIVTEVEDTAKIIINASKITEKPIVPIFIGGKYISFALQRFYDEKITAFKDISEGVETLAALYKYAKHTQKNEINIEEILNKGMNKDEVQKYTDLETKALPENVVTILAQEVLIELPKQALISNIEEGIQFANSIYPVVLKATTDVIAHKTDQKALYLNIKNEEELRQSYIELTDMIKHSFNILEPKVLIQEQITANEEIFIGATRDGNSEVYLAENSGFGHLIAFGKGGIYTEVYKDIGYTITPTSKEEIEEALRKTKVYKIIEGARGKDKLAFDKLVELIEKVQRLVLLYPEIESLDINPVLLTTNRAVTVDLKIFVRK